MLEAQTRCDRSAALARDPIRFARTFSQRDDREFAALLAALLAFGNVEAIGSKLRDLFARLGPSPALAATTWKREELHRALDSFVHRTFRGSDIADLLAGTGTLARTHGSLFQPLKTAYEEHKALRPALEAWVTLVRSKAFPDGVDARSKHLLPAPSGASACKRLLLLCRWCSRPDDGIDLGLGVLPTSALVMPLDVHVHRIALELGFTQRKSASWLAAEEVTEALRALDPEDPVRFDFALCHVEIAALRAQRLTRKGRIEKSSPA